MASAFTERELILKWAVPIDTLSVWSNRVVPSVSVVLSSQLVIAIKAMTMNPNKILIFIGMDYTVGSICS